MLELRIIAAGKPMPLYDLPAALGRRGAFREIGDTIEGLIAFMDDLQGDVDLEDGGDDEPDDDTKDISWTEWHARGARRKAFAYEAIGNPGLTEDDEDDDPREDDGVDSCAAGDDEPRSGVSPACRFYGLSELWVSTEDDERRTVPAFANDDEQMRDDFAGYPGNGC
jgi:hypothetical protein